MAVHTTAITEWTEKSRSISVGDILEVRVTAIYEGGAFADTHNGIAAFIDVTGLPMDPGTRRAIFPELGDVLRASALGLDHGGRQLRMSMRAEALALRERWERTKRDVPIASTYDGLVYWSRYDVWCDAEVVLIQCGLDFYGRLVHDTSLQSRLAADDIVDEQQMAVRVVGFEDRYCHILVEQVVDDVSDASS